MKNFLIAIFLISLISLAFLFFFSNTKSVEILDKSNSKNLESELPDSLFLTLEIEQNPENLIDYIIETNIPLPIEVSISLQAMGGTNDDASLGPSWKRVTINKSPFQYSMIPKIEIGKIGPPSLNGISLPTGEYEASVQFYHNWGAKNGNPLAKKISFDISDVKTLKFKGKGSIQKARDKQRKYYWVVENIYGGETYWNKQELINKLGSFEEVYVTKGNPDVIKAYYFNEADMTIFISKPLNKILFWRSGKASS